MRHWLRYADLEARGLVNNRTQLKNLQTKYGFPKGRLLGPNTRAWTEEEVTAWEDGRPTAPKVCPVPTRKPGRPRKHHAEIANKEL
jgi:hypothetical protein